MPSSIARTFSIGTGKAGVGLDRVHILGSLEGTPTTLGSITGITTDAGTGQITEIDGTGTFRSFQVVRGTGQVTQTGANGAGGRNVAQSVTLVIPGVSQEQKDFINDLELNSEAIKVVSTQKGSTGSFLFGGGVDSEGGLTVTSVVWDSGTSGGGPETVQATVTLEGNFFNYADQLSGALSTIVQTPITVE